jgi:uncharacterized heparinase superfamily protein
LTLLLRSLPYLRWEQLTYRALRRAQYQLYRAVPQTTARWVVPAERAPEPAPRAVETIRSVFDSSFPHLNRPLWEQDAWLAGLCEGSFTFLNRTLDLRRVDWNRRYLSHLWNYQLHYFGYSLWCARAFLLRGDTCPMQRCQTLIEEWIASARIGRSDGWEPYPVSLRVVHWIYAYALLAEDYDDRQFLGRWRASIYQQLDFLSGRIEHHLLANHLIKNAKALVIGGLLFADDPRGKRWLEAGEELLWQELDEQVLSDGGHYERAPMYHAIALADFLECFALLRAFRGGGAAAETGSAQPFIAALPAQIELKLRAMARFLAAMTYADGTLALFNDSANAEEARPLPIIAAAERILGGDLRAYPKNFPQTGYYLWNSRDGAERIIVDAGPPAVAYNAGHAHCDLLSYELWLGGRPWVVDSGVHGYGGDRFRAYARSTRAHNTVSVNGREQSEIWGTFRLARRAELLSAEARGDEQTWEFAGAYGLYFDSDATHERRIQRGSDGEWVITDIVRYAELERASSFIHLHPRVRAHRVSRDSLAIECQAGPRAIVIEPFAAVQVEIAAGAEAPLQGWRFPDFGIAQPSAAIRFDYRARTGEPFGYRIRPAAHNT